MVRFAIIGTNFITDRLLNAAKQVSGFKLQAVYSRTEERAREYAALKGIETVYTNLDALCADDDIDAVYVASPNAFHEEQSIKLLKAGKHVLCEKPIAPDSAALDNMLRAARESGRVLMEAMMPAHTPAWDTICSLIPRLGVLRHATLAFCQYSSRYDRFKQGIFENAFNPALKNGALMDLGVYCLYAMWRMFGMPNALTGMSVMLRGGIDGQGSLIASYGDMQANAVFSKIVQGTAPSQILGESGSLMFDSVSIPRTATLTPLGGEAEHFDLSNPLEDMAYELKSFIYQVENGRMDEAIMRGSVETVSLLEWSREILGLAFRAR